MNEASVTVFKNFATSFRKILFFAERCNSSSSTSNDSSVPLWGRFVSHTFLLVMQAQARRIWDTTRYNEHHLFLNVPETPTQLPRRSDKVTRNCAKVTQTGSETVRICPFRGCANKPSFGLIQSKTSANPYLAGVLLDAQAGDCASDHQLLDF